MGPTYKLGKVLSSGGPFEVYAGVAIYPTGFTKLCVIKKLAATHASRGEFQEILRAEAYIGAPITHCNIVDVYGYADLGDEKVLISEFVAGVTLHDLLARCRLDGMSLSTPMVIHIGAECARAISYLQLLKNPLTSLPLDLLHGNLNPQNILLSFTGEVKLTDFAVAAARQRNCEEPFLTEAGGRRYPLPDRQSAGFTTISGDIYNLGCVLFEAFTGNIWQGQLAADADADYSSPAAIENALRTALGDTDVELESIIKRCLADTPQDRYSEASDLERDLLETAHSHQGAFARLHLAAFVPALFRPEAEALEEDIRQIFRENKPRAASGVTREPNAFTNTNQNPAQTLNRRADSAPGAKLMAPEKTATPPATTTYPTPMATTTYPTPMATTTYPTPMATTTYPPPTAFSQAPRRKGFIWLAALAATGAIAFLFLARSSPLPRKLHFSALIHTLQSGKPKARSTGSP